MSIFIILRYFANYFNEKKKKVFRNTKFVIVLMFLNTKFNRDRGQCDVPSHAVLSELLT